VLLLDDNLMSAMRIQPQLQRMGYQVHTARAFPVTASAVTDAVGPQVVLINLGSRNLDGVTLVSRCRENYPAARLIGFCGHLETEIRRAARDAGIDRILTNDQVFTELERALRKERLHEQPKLDEISDEQTKVV